MSAEQRLDSAVSLELYREVHAERLRAHRKDDRDLRGVSLEQQTWDDHRWLPVLVEEVGEVARALSDVTRNTTEDTMDAMRSELVQVAAMATAWVAALDEGARQ